MIVNLERIRNMNTTVTVRIANNYGQRAVYPACDTARKLADLIGTKTFTPRALEQIKSLGYAVAVEQQSL
jgi:hypothetical protein